MLAFVWLGAVEFFGDRRGELQYVVYSIEVDGDGTNDRMASAAVPCADRSDVVLSWFLRPRVVADGQLEVLGRAQHRHRISGVGKGSVGDEFSAPGKFMFVQIGEHHFSAQFTGFTNTTEDALVFDCNGRPTILDFVGSHDGGQRLAGESWDHLLVKLGVAVPLYDAGKLHDRVIASDGFVGRIEVGRINAIRPRDEFGLARQIDAKVIERTVGDQLCA